MVSFGSQSVIGNPVPRPQLVDVLELGTAERIDAVIEMKNPGVWTLGTPKNDDRMNGMAIVIEYAGKTGTPRWVAPPKNPWDYTLGREPAGAESGRGHPAGVRQDQRWNHPNKRRFTIAVRSCAGMRLTSGR